MNYQIYKWLCWSRYKFRSTTQAAVAHEFIFFLKSCPFVTCSTFRPIVWVYVACNLIASSKWLRQFKRKKYQKLSDNKFHVYHLRSSKSDKCETFWYTEAWFRIYVQWEGRHKDLLSSEQTTLTAPCPKMRNKTYCSVNSTSYTITLLDYKHKVSKEGTTNHER